MKRKFYIIGHNPNYISQAQNALKNKANALEPDIVCKNGDFWVYDSSDPLSQPQYRGALSLHNSCSQLANLLVQHPEYNLALIAWDMKNTGDSHFDFWRIRDIIQSNFLDILFAHGRAEMPMLFTSADNINYLIQWAAPYLKDNWSLGIDENHNPGEADAGLRGRGFCYTYGDGTSFFLGSTLNHLPEIAAAITMRNTGHSFSLVYAWTVTSESHMKAFLDIGVDAMVVNDPQKLDNLINGPYSDRFELATADYNPFNCRKIIYTGPSDFKVKTYKFVPDEMLVAVNHSDSSSSLLKIKDTGGTGNNMFNISYVSTTGDYAALSNFSNQLKGSQGFNSFITDLVYVSNSTLIAFSDGKLLKVSGTGGTGQFMFNVEEHKNYFSNIPNFTVYRMGDAKFNHRVTCLKYFNGFTFIGLEDGKLLKIIGTGGTGQNMFNVTEYDNHFETSSSQYSTYRYGDAKFMFPVRGMEYISGHLFLWFDSHPSYLPFDFPALHLSFNNSKVLKINGAGGSGQNMFALTETSDGFSNINPSIYNYYVGDAVFSGKVSVIKYVGGFLLIGLDNGKILKVNGVGGSGHNMFAVNETASNFTSVPGYNYYIGDSYFPGFQIECIESINGNLMLGIKLRGSNFIGFTIVPSGFSLKIAGVGGTGHNMFALHQSPTDFSSVAGYHYYKGDAAF